MRIFYIACLLTYAAFGQVPETRTITLSTTAPLIELRDNTTIIRGLSQIRDVSLDEERRTITLTASKADLAIAEWAAQELDRPTAASFKVAENDIVRAFPLPPTMAIQPFLELATATRSIAEVRIVFANSPTRILFMRGTPAQVSLMNWLLQQVEKGGDTGDQYTYGEAEYVRLLRIHHADSVQVFQEVATMVRTITDSRRLYTLNEPRIIMLRGSQQQLSLAQWLAEQVDRPAKTAEDRSKPREFRANPQADDLTSILYLDESLSLADFYQHLTSMRDKAQLRKTSGIYAQRLAAFRGTSAQISTVTSLAQQN